MKDNDEEEVWQRSVCVCGQTKVCQPVRDIDDLFRFSLNFIGRLISFVYLCRGILKRC